MRLGIFLDWRHSLMTAVLLLMLMTPNSSESAAGFWVEHKNQPPVSYQIVKVKTRKPTWLLSLQAALSRWQVSRTFLMSLLCQFLASCLLIWLNLLAWLIEKASPRPLMLGVGGFVWSRPLKGATLTVEMVVSLVPTVSQEAIIVENVSFFHLYQLATDSRSLPVIVSVNQSYPLVVSQNNDLYEINQNSLDIYQTREQKKCSTEPISHLSQVTESQNHSVITKTEGVEKKPKARRGYEVAIEQAMSTFYQTLNQKDKRRYAAVEAMKLGHGGQSYVARILGCSRKTVYKGLKEIENGYQKDPRIRESGGGRKPYTSKHPNIDEPFLAVLKLHTAGDPMKEEVIWTNLTQREIALRLEEGYGIKVSQTVIKQLLKKHNFRRRKAQKRRTMKQHALRNEQFENIARLRAEYEAAGQPICSMDSKKKESLGNYYRNGHLYTRAEVQTWDHDFKSMAEGVVIPHSLYDPIKNKGHITIGTSKDTSEFACASFKLWWNKYGKYDYPNATSLLLLCDGGGSNSSRHYIFKEDLQKLVNEIGIEIRIAHYPPYCSKYNPIEHRFFPHVTRACQGVIFENRQVVKELMEKTSTQTGLTTTVDILEKTYQTGRKYALDFKENMPIIFDDHLPQWNYRAVPNG